MSWVEEYQEAADAFDFSLVVTIEAPLFECLQCGALCRHEGLATHVLWHEHLISVIDGDGS